MPRAFSSAGAGDAHTGGGYGTLSKSPVGADSKAEEVWPYTSLTDLEKQADQLPDEEIDDRKSIKKKVKKEVPADNLAQLNYKPHSFVNGSTRGLTGIMSGMDPKQILEQIIDEVRPMTRRPRRGDASQGIFGQKPIGLGAVQPNTMSSDPTTRTRPGQGLGSKQGWFSPAPPKPSDPSNVEHAYSLKDIADADEERPVRHARIEKDRVKIKSNVTEENIALLRSYVRIVSRSP